MTGGLPEHGTLEDTPLPRLLLELHRQGFGGTLTLSRDGLDIEVEVEADLVRGYPASGPSYACGGEPGEGDSLEDVRAYRVLENGRRGEEVELDSEEIERAERALMRE